MKNFALMALIPLLLTSCPGMMPDLGLNGGLDGRLEGENRAELLRRLGNAQVEVNAKSQNKETLAASPFNSLMQSNGLFRAMEAEKTDIAEAFLADPDRGFGFKCHEESGVEKYKMALKDFSYNANLIGMLLNGDAFKEIQQHEKGLKEIPIAVARESFLKGYANPSANIVLPKGTKKSLDGIKKKYDKLKELKKSLIELQTNRSASIKERYSKAMKQLDEYDNIKVHDELKQLVTEAKLDEKYINSNVQSPLTSVREMLQNGLTGADGAGAISDVTKRNQEIDAKLELLNKDINGYYEDLLSTVYQESANVVGGSTDQFVQEFFDKSRKELMENSIEATGWSFDMGMKFDLMKNVIKAKPDIDEQAVFAHMQRMLKTDKAASEKSKAEKATAFFKNYEQLQYYKGNKFFNNVFGKQIDSLEDSFDLDEDSVGEVSSFRHFMSILCKDKWSSCSVADIFGDTYRDADSFAALSQSLAKLVSVNPFTREMLIKRLNAIQASRSLLESKFASCHSQVTDEKLKAAIKVRQEDYIQCSLLEGVISTSGLGTICGEDSASYQAQKRIDDASGSGATVIRTGADSADSE